MAKGKAASNASNSQCGLVEEYTHDKTHYADKNLLKRLLFVKVVCGS